MSRSFDFVVAGAGIVGVTLAREIKQRWPEASVLLLEKEPSPGRHSSGRNSGVLHSGIYYPEGTLKAKLCAEGARRLAAYCEDNRLSIARWGKIILPTAADNDGQLDVLRERAQANGARAEIVDASQLADLEPAARTPSGRALYAPDTAVIDSKAVLDHILEELRGTGVKVETGTGLRPRDGREGALAVGGGTVHYGCLVNAAGLHADRVARGFGAGRDHTILPFKGVYWSLAQNSGIQLNRLIYPVPDLRVPFLGIHFTRELEGSIQLGPSALPALGREHYGGLRGIEPLESARILGRLGRQYLANRQGFRRLVHRELAHLQRSRFAAAAATMVPAVRLSHLRPAGKRGIRAQLLESTHGTAGDGLRRRAG